MCEKDVGARAVNWLGGDWLDTVPVQQFRCNRFGATARCKSFGGSFGAAILVGAAVNAGIGQSSIGTRRLSARCGGVRREVSRATAHSDHVAADWRTSNFGQCNQNHRAVYTTVVEIGQNEGRNKNGSATARASTVVGGGPGSRRRRASSRKPSLGLRVPWPASPGPWPWGPFPSYQLQRL